MKLILQITAAILAAIVLIPYRAAIGGLGFSAALIAWGTRERPSVQQAAYEQQRAKGRDIYGQMKDYWA